MNPTLTAVLAVWGAMLATFTACWQIFQWLRAKPRIHVKATMMENPIDGPADDWIEFEIRNRGGMPTTVEEIMFVSYERWFTQLLRFPNRVENLWIHHPEDKSPHLMELPTALPPSGLWKGSCYLGPREDLPHLDSTRRERFLKGKLFYRIRCAHTNQTINGTVKPRAFWERL